MLRYYGKMESDEIICGRPPQNPGEECGPVLDVDFLDYIGGNEVVDIEGGMTFTVGNMGPESYTDPPD